AATRGCSTRDRSERVSSRQQAPLARDARQAMHPPIVELEPRARDEIVHGLGDEHLEAERLHSARDRPCAANRPGRTVEDGEHPIASRADLAAAKTRELGPDDGVVAIEQLVPASVSELLGLRGRAYEVGEEHRDEHAARLGLLV